MLRFATSLLALASTTLAHTWIEEYQVIGPNGTYIGDKGYSRGYVARTDPTFEGDANILWLLPELSARMQDGSVRNRINSSDLLCHPNQRTANYSNPEYPPLKVQPGSYVAMKYLENGHVTLPWNQAGKPQMGGTVYVYGTMNPSSTEKIADVLLWNANQTGGNRRGWLMATQNYDDGRCHQINDCDISAERQVRFPLKVPGQPTSPSQEQWCESDLKIPTTQKGGKLTTYWVWQWPTDPNKDCIYPDGKDEYYTTCADFEVEAPSPGDEKIAAEPATNTLIQECPQTKAVSTYQERQAITTSRPIILDNWNRVLGHTNAVNPSFSSACSASLVAMQDAPATVPPSCPADKWATGALFASISSRVLAEMGYTPKLDMPASTSGVPPPATTPVPGSVPAPDTAVASAPPTTFFTTSTYTSIYSTAVATVTSVAPAAPPPSAPPAPPAVKARHVARHRVHARHFD